MKYNLQIEIDRPINEVAALLAEPANLQRWQGDLLSYETQEGEQGCEGARSRLLYKIGKKQYEMTETIVVRRLPEEYRLIVEARGVWNEVINRFTEVQPGRTLWAVETEFRCRGLMWFMSLVMPGMFKTQTENYMRQFKLFAEAEADGAIAADPQGETTGG